MTLQPRPDLLAATTEAQLQTQVQDLLDLTGWHCRKRVTFTYPTMKGATVARTACACGCGNYPTNPRARVIRGHQAPTLHQRVDAKLDTSGKCWVWTGSTSNKGYGRVHSDGRDGPVLLVHRVQYERYFGPIPADLTVDHLCRNTVCGNPAHMELVTAAENTRRGDSPGMVLHRAGVCARGHSVSIHGYRSAKGKGYCRACRSDRRRKS